MASWSRRTAAGSTSTRCSSAWFNTTATVRHRLAPVQPASLVVFDVLAVGSVDVRPMRGTARRQCLESLARNWPPLQLPPVTSDVDEGKEWLEVFKLSGVEGLVVKGASTRYQPGRRDWVKGQAPRDHRCDRRRRHRQPAGPEALVVGRYRGNELEIVGRTVKLKDDQAAEIGKLLKPAWPRHPWPDEISTHWGKGSKTPRSRSSRV
ncbi:ATP dependent DNA ligase-like protein [Kribbella orskensis]|uniref:ATP dependent DNA ligase-like protein n=1 Tax=Kribbella orskensis TaxID=2512216 RepID=A0ABY2BDW6_9ACTN|nr:MULTISPECIES: hypothetical protein [Kribbella]TCN35606.1 ATP dependent DNA ligase-like protein [Kribbella sp. VKM Ac-2500]TCO17148.1 ATP dependent DNA ligase-like protein [Kribbella orskensis]